MEQSARIVPAAWRVSSCHQQDGQVQLYAVACEHQQSRSGGLQRFCDFQSERGETGAHIDSIATAYHDDGGDCDQKDVRSRLTFFALEGAYCVGRSEGEERWRTTAEQADTAHDSRYLSDQSSYVQYNHEDTIDHATTVFSL